MEVGACACFHFYRVFCWYIAGLSSPPLFRLSIHLFNQYNWLEKPGAYGLSFPLVLLPLCLLYKQDIFQSRFVPSEVVFGGQLDFSCSLSQWLVELGCADLPVCLTCICLCPCDLQVGHSPWMMKCPLTSPALPWQFLRSNKNGNKKR